MLVCVLVGVCTCVGTLTHWRTDALTHLGFSIGLRRHSRFRHTSIPRYPSACIPSSRAQLEKRKKEGGGAGWGEDLRPLVTQDLLPLVASYKTELLPLVNSYLSSPLTSRTYIHTYLHTSSGQKGCCRVNLKRVLKPSISSRFIHVYIRSSHLFSSACHNFRVILMNPIKRQSEIAAPW